MLLHRTSHAAKNRNNFSKMMSHMGRRYPTLNRARHLQQESLDNLVLSASRSSTTASTPHIVHTTRLRTLATTVFIRGVATRASKDPLVQLKEAAEAEPLSLGDFKKEVTTLIEKEVKESSAALDPAAEYLAELNYKLVVSEGVATLKRTQGKQVIEISFTVEEEEDEEEDSKEESEQEEAEEEESEGEPEGQDVDLFMGAKELYIPTEVKISIMDKMNKEVSSLSLSCSAHEGRFFIDTLYSADGQNAVHFEQFSERLQEKIYDYLESLKLDNRLGTFISEYTRNYHAHKSAQVLSDLSQFVSHLRDE